MSKGTPAICLSTKVRPAGNCKLVLFLGSGFWVNSGFWVLGSGLVLETCSRTKFWLRTFLFSLFSPFSSSFLFLRAAECGARAPLSAPEIRWCPFVRLVVIKHLWLRPRGILNLCDEASAERSGDVDGMMHKETSVGVMHQTKSVRWNVVLVTW